MMIEWPPNLIEELAHKRCVIFIGSGISASSIGKNPQGEPMKPLTWKEFIEGAKSLINPQSSAIAYINTMISQNNYLKALQAIKNNCDSGSYARYLKTNFSDPAFEANNIHQEIKKINSKIVVTTNFDKIYENLCGGQGYTVANYYDPISKIISNIKSSENLIVKAHGTIDDINNIIFTENEYFNARKIHSEFYSILQALFLTHTVVFLGYSLNDPDINLLLEIANRTKVETNPHYVVIPVGTDEELKKQWKECYNINTLEYGPDYTHLEENIVELSNQVYGEKAAKQLPE